jgi:maltose O-acetyltransferase
MTQSTDRLDRIEALLATVAESQARTEANLSRTEQLVAQNAAGLRETRAIADSNARAIEARSSRIEEGIAEAEEVSSSMSANTNTRMEDAIADTVQMIANLGQQQQEAMHRHQEADQRFEVFLAEARADRQRADRDRALNESEHRAFRETFQTMLAEIDRLWQRVAG